MRLSAFSDYSLRVLMFLGGHRDRLSTISEIAEFYGISENHLMKVVNQLGAMGYVAKEPTKIKLGDVIRDTESDFALAECFGENSVCRIQTACALQTVLSSALAGMFAVLDRHTLEDIIIKPNVFIQFIKRKATKTT